MSRHRVTRLGDSTMVHCNMFRQLEVREVEDVHYRSSQARHARLDSRTDLIRTAEDVKFWLGDTQGELAVFRTEDKPQDVLLTLATGRPLSQYRQLLQCFQEYLISKRRK